MGYMDQSGVRSDLLKCRVKSDDDDKNDEDNDDDDENDENVDIDDADLLCGIRMLISLINLVLVQSTIRGM